MSRIMDDAIRPALATLDLQYLWGSANNDQDVVIVPMPISESTTDQLLIVIRADEELKEVVIEVSLLEIPPGRYSAAALVLAQLNNRYKGVTFAFGRNGDVRVHAFVELTFASDPAPLVALSIARLGTALSRSFAEIAGVTSGKVKRGMQPYASPPRLAHPAMT